MKCCSSFYTSTKPQQVQHQRQPQRQPQKQPYKPQIQPSSQSEQKSLQYSSMPFYEANMLEHIFSTATLDHPAMLQVSPYLNTANNALQYAKMDIQNKNRRFDRLTEPIEKQLSFAVRAYQGYLARGGSHGAYYQMQSWIILIVHIYKCFADGYDVCRRRLLKSIFSFFNIGTLQNPYECLRWLESHRTQILSLPPVSHTISQASSLIFDLYKERERFLKGTNFNQLPNFTLQLLSSTELPRKKTVNIWVSGFLSEDMDKKSHWAKLTAFMPESEIYAVQWASDKIGNLVKFIAKACVDLITADKMQQELKKKFADNPFIPAMAMSVNLGKYLAEMVVRLFPNQFINIAGYSLGSQMIKSFIQHLILLNSEHLVNNIYMLGGVTDTTELEGIIESSKYPLSVHNLFTDNDMVLKKVLSLCLPDKKPIGIHKIKQAAGHEITNLDCSGYVSGHLDYMSEFQAFGKSVYMNRD